MESSSSAIQSWMPTSLTVRTRPYCDRRRTIHRDSLKAATSVFALRTRTPSVPPVKTRLSSGLNGTTSSAGGLRVRIYGLCVLPRARLVVRSRIIKSSALPGLSDKNMWPPSTICSSKRDRVNWAHAATSCVETELSDAPPTAVKGQLRGGRKRYL